MIFCPACHCGHFFDDERWTFNGNEESPTFGPSMKVSGHLGRGPNGEDQHGICHSVVTDGKIAFQNDCTHALAGQTLPLGPF